MSRFTIAFVATLALIATQAQAASWFVATGGSDVNSGSQAAPFRTITKAATMARPGDIVEVRGGVYNEVVKIFSKGTATARITFRAYGSEIAVIDGTGSPAGTNLVQLSGAQFVDFSRFEVRNATRLGICGYPVQNVRINGNTVHNSEKNGIYIGSTSVRSSDVVIENNTVRNNVLMNEFHNLTGGWGQAIGIQSTDRVTIRGNTIFQNDGEGVAVILSDDAVVKGNQVYDNFSVGIYLDNAQSSLVDSNFVYSTGNTRYYRSGFPAAGIGTANESYSTSNPLSGLTIVNNVVVNTKWGFYYGNYEAGGGLKASTIANNTFYRSWQPMLWLESSSHTGTIIENNVFHQAGGAPISSVAGTGVLYRNNNWYGGNAGAAAGSGDLIGDPRLVNPGGLTARDYMLTTGSIAIDGGVALSAVTSDYFGNSRGVVLDMGAHELGSGSAPIAPAPDAQPPTVPTGLRTTSVNTTSIAIAWSPSTDNVGVTGYKIYRNGVQVASVSETSWSDASLNAGTTYSYNVAAFDAIGNTSAKSATLSATTSKARKLRAVR